MTRIHPNNISQFMEAERREPPGGLRVPPDGLRRSAKLNSQLHELRRMI